MKLRLAGTLGLALMLAWTVSAFATPNLLQYQGRLTDASGNPSNGSFTIVFSIYAAASGGSALYTETITGVTVTNGLFTVLIGNVTTIPVDLFEGATKFLGIKVGADAEMTPRQAVASVPFAIHSTFAQGVPWAIVRSDGVIIRQSGGFTASRSSAGVYIVDTPFNESFVGFMVCSFNVPGAGIVPAIITAFATGGGGYDVRVYNTGFAAADHDFAIMIPTGSGATTAPQTAPVAATAELRHIDPKTNLPIN